MRGKLREDGCSSGRGRTGHRRPIVVLGFRFVRRKERSGAKTTAVAAGRNNMENFGGAIERRPEMARRFASFPTMGRAVYASAPHRAVLVWIALISSFMVRIKGNAHAWLGTVHFPEIVSRKHNMTK